MTTPVDTDFQKISELYAQRSARWEVAYMWLSNHPALSVTDNGNTVSTQLFERNFSLSVTPDSDSRSGFRTVLSSTQEYRDNHNGETITVSTPFGLESTIVELARLFKRLYTDEGPSCANTESTHVVVVNGVPSVPNGLMTTPKGVVGQVERVIRT